MLDGVRATTKSLGKELVDHCQRLDTLINTTLPKAEKENSTVYLQRIPSAADLPAISGEPLVKPTPPMELDGAAEGLFPSAISAKR